MVKKLLSLIAVTLFTLSLVGPVLAAEMAGMVTAVEREGRYITIKSNDGKMTVTVRISSSSTELNGVGDRADITMGQKITATYDEGDDRKTASMVVITLPKK